MAIKVFLEKMSFLGRKLLMVYPKNAPIDSLKGSKQAYQFSWMGDSSF
jgi:hypothetical protein